MKSFGKNIIQFIKFNLVGVLNTLVDFGVYTLLTSLGLNNLIAQCISYACGMLNSYLLNTLWTFKVERKRTTTEFIKFACVNLVSLGTSLGILSICKYWFMIDNVIYQKLIATPISLVVNFIGNKLFVFRSEETEKK